MCVWGLHAGSNLKELTVDEAAETEEAQAAVEPEAVDSVVVEQVEAPEDEEVFVAEEERVAAKGGGWEVTVGWMA